MNITKKEGLIKLVSEILMILILFILFFIIKNDSKQNMRIRCLEFGTTYIGDDFCGKYDKKNRLKFKKACEELNDGIIDEKGNCLIPFKSKH